MRQLVHTNWWYMKISSLHKTLYSYDTQDESSVIYWIHCTLLGKQHHVKWFIYHNFSEKFFWYDNNKTLKMCIFCYPSTTTLGVIETVKNSKAYFQSSIQFLLIWNKYFEENLDQINVFCCTLISCNDENVSFFYH